MYKFVSTKWIVRLLAAVLLFSISGYSSVPSSASDSVANESVSNSGQKPPSARVTVRLAGGHTAGAGYAWCLAASNLLTKYGENITGEVMETDGTTETTNTLLAGEIKLGVTSSTPTFCAYSGLLDFKGNPISDIRIVLATYDDAFQIMCPKNSDIKTIQDLKGKRVSLNTMGGGGYLTSVLLLGALGIDAANDIRPYYLTMSESASAVQEGSLDAFIYIGGPGASVGLEMAASNSGLKIISLSEEEIQTIMAEVPVLSPKQISVGTYPGVDYEIRTVGGATSLISTEAVPTEEVYEALKILCEHHDEFVSTNSQAAFSTAENTIISFPKGSIPLHSGAEKYFRELGLIK